MSALSVESLSEHDLIEAARDGDQRAFEELYARYQGRILAFIRSRVRDQGRAEDVAQEVFISALRRLRTSTQEIAFKPWIYEIAKNACIDEYRRSRRGREVPLGEGGEDEPSPELLSTAPTPPAAIEAKERLSDLRGAFGVLSESHHQLIVMREFEGRSYDEIGERTGMSRQMVESALFRARRKLTEEYEELASGRRCVQIQSAIEAGRATSARSLGVRERRRFARHLAHCQPCRMHAQFADVDHSLLATRSGLGSKIAGLLPFPLLRRFWPGRGGRSAMAHPQALSTLQSASEPAAATSLGGAAVAAAVLALAGAGAVVAPDASRGQGAPAHPAAHAAPAAPAARTPITRPALPPAVTPAPATARRARPPASPVTRLEHHGAVLRHHPVAGRHVAPGAAPRSSAASAPASGSGSGSGSAPSAVGGVTRRRGVPLRPGSSSAGTVVRSSGGVLATTISAAGHTVATLTGALPISSTVSSLGDTLASTTASATGSVAGTADAAAGGVEQTTAALGPAASAAGSAAGSAGTVAGVAGTLRGVVHGLTSH